MRTVSFSNRQVQNLLNENFINTFTNTTGDPTAGMSINHRPGDQAGNCVRGNGKQNVQTIFLTPDGEIFHAATGFLASEDLVSEIKFAIALYRQLDQHDAPSELVANEHRQRLVDAGFLESEIEDLSSMAAIRMMSKQLGNRSSQNAGLRGFNLQGSESRNSGMAGRGSSQRKHHDPFAAFSKMQFLTDNQFSMAHPLLTFEELQQDPSLLVGNGKSFFSSSSSLN
jgi:hypothetical protein